MHAGDPSGAGKDAEALYVILGARKDAEALCVILAMGGAELKFRNFEQLEEQVPLVDSERS